MYDTPDQIKLLKHYPEGCPSLRIVFVQTNTLTAFFVLLNMLFSDSLRCVY